MAKYLVKITVKDKRTGKSKNLYGVYSTAVNDWIIGLYPSLRNLREIYPNLRKVKPIPYKKLFGRKAEAILEGNKIVLKYPIYEFGSSKRKSRKRKSRKKKRGR